MYIEGSFRKIIEFVDFGEGGGGGGGYKKVCSPNPPLNEPRNRNTILNLII